MAAEIVTIADVQAGTKASVLVSFGFNCFEFVARDGDEPVNVLWSEPGFEAGDKRASGSGIPILFPFPGRLRGTSFVWDENTYELKCGTIAGNSIHGFLLDRPWRVVEQTEQRVVGEFQAAVDDPSLLDQWPVDFRVTAEYEITGNILKMSYRIENPDTKILPFGFGTHPYFRLPLGEGSASACRISLPVRKRWLQIEMLPTGKQAAVEPIEEFHQGLAFDEMQFDDVFTDLVFEQGVCTSRLVDEANRRQAAIEFDQAFRECVVYNPPHREAVCIEPYSCVPNAAELQAAGVDSGWRTLEPSAVFAAQTRIYLV